MLNSPLLGRTQALGELLLEVDNKAQRARMLKIMHGCQVGLSASFFLSGGKEFSLCTVRITTYSRGNVSLQR
jgi:hypothetical protein